MRGGLNCTGYKFPNRPGSLGNRLSLTTSVDTNLDLDIDTFFPKISLLSLTDRVFNRPTNRVCHV